MCFYCRAVLIATEWRPRLSLGENLRALCCGPNVVTSAARLFAALNEAADGDAVPVHEDDHAL